MNQPIPPTTTAYDDEIDLFELFQTLWDQKGLITAITGLVTAMGVVFAVMMPPVYQTEARLLPPLAQDVQAFNISLMDATMDGQVRKDLLSLSPNQVYSQLQTNLNSVSLRRMFFETSISASLDPNPEQTPFNRFDKHFNQNLSVASASGRNADTSQVTVQLEGSNPEQIAQWINEFIEYSAQLTKQDLIQQAELVLTNEVQKLADEIDSKRTLAQSRREDRIATLKEALVIAKAMGLSTPMIDQAANQLNMEYMRGTRSIEAEINVLKNRTSDDPFISDMRNLQERIAFLQGIKINPDTIQIVRVDQAAEVPTSAIKPNKKLIAAVALVLGGMLGVFIALIRSAVRKRRQSTIDTAKA